MVVEGRTADHAVLGLPAPVGGSGKERLLMPTGIGAGGVVTPQATAAPLLIGQDPLEIERHVHLMRSVAYFMGRPWAVEVALWDIAGKVYGLPISDLLVYRGAGFVVPVAGAIKLMPGTSSNPAFRRIDVDVETGRVKGLF